MGPFADEVLNVAWNSLTEKKLTNKLYAWLDPWPTANEKLNLVSNIMVWLSARNHI